MERLKYVRNTRGWTQADLAEAIGISETYYRHIEAGRAIPSLELLKKLMSELKVLEPLELGYDIETVEKVVIDE